VAEIDLQNVQKRFGDFTAVRESSFTIHDGEFFVLLGPSGCGKTTTLRMIAGLELPTEGKILLDGEDVTYKRASQRDIGFVFQLFALYPRMTVRENIAFPLENRPDLAPDQIEARVRELEEMLEVTEFADRLPAELSTGTKRAVAIARALAQDPEAILFDEPTTMVDPLMAAHTGDLILKLKEKFRKTSVVVTHDTHLAKKLADRVVFLHEGRVAFFGPWAEFESTSDPFLRNFRLLDELIPALDVTA